MELEDIKKEKFDGLLAKRQICQYFPPLINTVVNWKFLGPANFVCNKKVSTIQKVRYKRFRCIPYILPKK